jgi:alkylation response protein AidB-like acyl-CoA dehydrogenase
MVLNGTAIVEEARAFVASEIMPYATLFDQQGEIPRALIDKLGACRYLGANFPQVYGGLGLEPVYYGQLTEEIGKACSSVRSLLTVHASLVGESLLRFGNEKQKRALLPPMAAGEMLAAFALSEPEVGSDAKDIRTSYRTVGDDFVIQGEKKWITMAGVADILLVIATNEGTTSAFLVPTDSPGVSITPMRGLMAGRASHVAEISFRDVVVTKENLLGAEGIGFRYIVNTALDHGRYSIAWGGLGIAQAALEAMVTYARSRKQFGKKIHTFQLIQAMIADALTKITAGRALCLRVGELRKKNHADAIPETTMAKYYTSRIANQITSDAVQLHGGNGISDQYPVERLFREAKVLEIIEGTSQVLQTVIADHALGRFNRKELLVTVKQ